MEIVGYVRDSCYGSVRETIGPTVYVPIESTGGGRSSSGLRQTASARGQSAREISKGPSRLPGARHHYAKRLVQTQMLREKLLATISSSSRLMALVLAGVGPVRRG